MIISHRLKFAFFRIPKTGSTTAEVMLRLSGAFDSDDYMTPNVGLEHTIPMDVVESAKETYRQKLKDNANFRRDPIYFETALNNSVWSVISHMTPTEAISYGLITLEQLREYKTYAFMRVPRDRHLSAYSHSLGTAFPLPDGYFKAVQDGHLTGNLLAKPSTDYFIVDGEQVLDPLWFSEYDDEIKRVISEVGGYAFKEIPRLNPSRSRVTNKEAYFGNHEVNEKLQTILADDNKLFVQLRKERNGIQY